MRLQLTYWKPEGSNHFQEIDIEFDKIEDYDFVPYGEGHIKRKFVEYDVYVYGDVPEEIKNSIKMKFSEGRKFYHGATENFEYEAE